MDKANAKKRIDELNRLTAYYAKKYYDDDEPEISDFEYDMLMLELRNLEKEFPEFVSKDSLTQKVGGTVKEGFSKVEHSVPLQSLQDVFSFDGCESIEWLFLLSNNKIQVTDIKHYRVNMYDWLIYTKDTICVDNPLLYQIEFIEDPPSDN